jgi:hypothetical protein
MPDRSALGWDMHKHLIAIQIFGYEVATRYNKRRLRASIATLTDNFLSRVRQNWSTGFKKRRLEINAKRTKLLSSMQGIHFPTTGMVASADGGDAEVEASPHDFTRKRMLEILKDANAYYELAAKIGATHDIDLITKWRAGFAEVRKVIMAEEDGTAHRTSQRDRGGATMLKSCLTDMPPHMEAAISRVLMDVDKKVIADDIQRLLEQHDDIAQAYEPDPAAEGMEGGAAVARDFNIKLDPTEEELNTHSLEYLYQHYLGLPLNGIPGLWTETVKPGLPAPDRSRVRNIPDDDKAPLLLDKRQVVGIVRMLLNSFRGMPIINSDEVGVGKTFQVLGLVAVLRWFGLAFTQKGQFPGNHFSQYTLSS